MKILISNQSEKAIYKQITEQIEEQILNGQIQEGTALPSIRKLASEIGVSVITTTRAYKELEEAGFIASMQGKGSVVLSPKNHFLREQYLIRIEEGLLQAVTSAYKIEMSREEFQSIAADMWKEIASAQERKS